MWVRGRNARALTNSFRRYRAVADVAATSLVRVVSIILAGIRVVFDFPPFEFPARKIGHFGKNTAEHYDFV